MRPLPTRAGERPRTTPTNPHTQLDRQPTDLTWIEDLDDSSHLLVVSRWTTRQRADEVLREYADHPNARRANELVSRPRTRFVGHALPSGA